jgi:DNA integrity scanning protein DisA with diadenylate cyclase activity
LNCYLSPFTDKYIDVSTCIRHLSMRRHGALIAVERNDPIEPLVQSGIPIGAAVSHSLLESIFYPGNPLHDGAVLIRNNQILSAKNILPLESALQVGMNIGTCHRVVIGNRALRRHRPRRFRGEGKAPFAAIGKLYRLSQHL